MTEVNAPNKIDEAIDIFEFALREANIDDKFLI